MMKNEQLTTTTKKNSQKPKPKPYVDPYKNTLLEAHNQRLKKAHRFRMTLMRMTDMGKKYSSLKNINSCGIYDNEQLNKQYQEYQGSIFLSKDRKQRNSQKKLSLSIAKQFYSPEKRFATTRYKKVLFNENMNSCKFNQYRSQHLTQNIQRRTQPTKQPIKNHSFQIKSKIHAVFPQQTTSNKRVSLPQRTTKIINKQKFRKYQTEEQKQPVLYESQLFYPIDESSYSSNRKIETPQEYDPEVVQRFQQVKKKQKTNNFHQNFNKSKDAKIYSKQRYKKILKGLQIEKKQISVSDKNLAWAILNQKPHNAKFASIRQINQITKKKLNELYDKRTFRNHPIDNGRFNRIGDEKTQRSKQNKMQNFFRHQNFDIAPWEQSGNAKKLKGEIQQIKVYNKEQQSIQ